MKALKRCVWVIVALLSASTVMAREARVTDSFRLSPLRVEPGFSGNYLKDAATVAHKQVRAEFSGQSFPRFERIEIRNYDFIATYGIWPKAEVGVDVPVLNVVPRDEGFSQELGVGDISVWGKYKLMESDELTLTGGFELQAETADDSQVVPCDGEGTTCGLGLPRHGFNPFGAFRYQVGNLGVGGHVGYEFYDDPLGNVVNYDVSTMFAATYDIVLRVEFTGYSQFDGKDRHIFSVAPGIDWMMDYLTLRVGGFKGVTADAADWGIGGGFALTFGGQSS